MLGLNAGELTLFAILVFAVVSAKFWPAVGARIAERLSGRRPEQPGNQRRPEV